MKIFTDLCKFRKLRKEQSGIKTHKSTSIIMLIIISLFFFFPQTLYWVSYLYIKSTKMNSAQLFFLCGKLHL